MIITRSIALEPIYVVGDHETFVEAISKRISEVTDQHGPLTNIVVKHISHTLAFDSDGDQHWSAFVTIEMESEREDEDD